MPSATFISEETKKAFYEKYNKQVMDKYYSDPEFRKKKLDARKAIYERHKELGIGRFSPEGIARVNELARLKYQRIKAEKLAENGEEIAEKVDRKSPEGIARIKEYKKEWYKRKKAEKVVVV